MTLELGGKSANVVFADADLEAAAAAAPGAVFGNAGQDCCARSRILVQEQAMDPFMAALEREVLAMRVGDPLAEDTQMGPLISAGQRETVSSFLDDGERVAFRGRAPEGPGFWFAPTVLAPVDPGARVAREEVFGPIAAVIPFRDEEQAVALANDSIYGLSGSIWTRDGARALRVARALETGVLSINSNSSVRVTTPFGGFKQSGYGRELGPHALDAYSEVKTIFYSTEGNAELMADGQARGTGVRGDGRQRRDRRRDRRAVRPRGRPCRRARTWPRGRPASCRCRSTSPRRSRCARCTSRCASATGASTCCSTTPASPRPRTPPCWRPRWRPGSGFRRSTCSSVFLCCKHGIPHLLESGGGSVINTASFVAVMGAATSQISYTASKGGVLALSRELGVEFARRGVRVNALCPGPVDTPLLQELYASDPEQAAAAAGARAGGPLRPRRGDRQRGAVPRQRRVELRDRLHLPGRRRAQRRLHDAAVEASRRAHSTVSVAFMPFASWPASEQNSV